VAVSSDAGSPVGRRVFLGLLGLGAVGVAAGPTLNEWYQQIAKEDPTGLSSLIGGSGWHYYTVTGEFPSRSQAAWRLDVGGLVDQPFALGYRELLAMPATHLDRDFQCVTGWRVTDVGWKGVRLAHLLERAGVQAEGKAVRFTCFDGAYTESLTLEQARRDDVIVAYELDGKPIGSDHGGPVRLYVAPMYGYKSAKWLSGIHVTKKVIPGYWEERGYDIDAWVGESNGRNDDQT
jgi:DMSO/TMAO reductase YedYZ molybdopterin-dependent catalytic subunit